MKLLLRIFLNLLPVLISAQAVEVSNGSKLPPKTSKFKVIGKNNDGVIVRLYGTVDVIDVYDENLKLLSSKTIEFKNQDGILQHIMLNKTGAVIFYLEQDKKNSVLYAQPVNSKFMEIGKPLVIDSITDRKDLVASNLRFKTSVDQSSLMIYYPFFNFTKVESIKFICLDNSLKTIYNKTIPLSKDEKDLADSKTLIDNAGSSFMLFKQGGKAGKVYEVVHISSNGESSTYNLETEKEIFGDPFFEIDNKNGNLVMTALYDDKKRIGEDVANGFMYAAFDPANGTKLKMNYTPFSKEFISTLTGRENVTNQSLYTFNIRKAILRNDGGVLILAESFIKDTREIPVTMGIQPGFNNYRNSEIFQFNDIIAFSVNAAGEMEWNAVLRKKQVSEDDNGAYSSFLIANRKEKLHLLYLDDISSSGILKEYVLSSQGKYEHRTVLNQEDKEVVLLPKMGKQISPNEVIIPSYISNNLRLVKLTF